MHFAYVSASSDPAALSAWPARHIQLLEGAGHTWEFVNPTTTTLTTADLEANFDFAVCEGTGSSSGTTAAAALLRDAALPLLIGLHRAGGSSTAYGVGGSLSGSAQGIWDMGTPGEVTDLAGSLVMYSSTVESAYTNPTTLPVGSTLVATLNNAPDRACAWAVPAGAPLVGGGIAPAPRFCLAQHFVNLSSNLPTAVYEELNLDGLAWATAAPPAPDPSPVITNLVGPIALTATSFAIAFDTDVDAVGHGDVSSDDGATWVEAGQDAGGLSHEVTLAGLVGGSTYLWRARAVGAEGTRTTSAETVTQGRAGDVVGYRLLINGVEVPVNVRGVIDNSIELPLTLRIHRDGIDPEAAPEVGAPPPGTAYFLASYTGDRADPFILDGTTLDAPPAIFVEPIQYVDRVAFGPPNDGYSEGTAPYDLFGADPATNLANLWPDLLEGENTVTALVTYLDGRPDENISATFVYAPAEVIPGEPEPDPVTPPPPAGDATIVTYEETGVQDGVELRPYTGNLTITQDGAVIEGLDISGLVSIQAYDVTMRNCRARSGTASYVISVAKGFSGTLIEHVDVQATGEANGVIGNLGDHAGTRSEVAGDNVTVRYSRITGGGDGIKVANYGLYEKNYIRVRRTPLSRKHIDGIQASGRHHFTARGNYVDQEYSGGHNSAIFVQAYTGSSDVPVVDVLVERNFLNGGVYTFHSEDGKKVEGPGGTWMTNVVCRDNRFGRGYHYGVAHFEGITGNAGVWDDTGEPVPFNRID